MQERLSRPLQIGDHVRLDWPSTNVFVGDNQIELIPDFGTVAEMGRGLCVFCLDSNLYFLNETRVFSATLISQEEYELQQALRAISQ